MPDAPAWTLARDAEGLVTLTLDKPGTSANVLSKAVLTELDSLLDKLCAEPPRAVVVRSAKTSGFVAGADINEFVPLTSRTTPTR